MLATDLLKPARWAAVNGIRGYRKMLTDSEYFEALSMPEPNSGCWLWVGQLNHKEYGRVRHNGRTIAAHRWSYILHKGPIPDGLVVMHSCDNPACVNPDHLSVGTYNDNNQDKARKGRDAKGTAHGQAKISPDLVMEIVQRCRGGELPEHVARDYGVSGTAVRHVMSGACWSHVTGIPKLPPRARAALSEKTV